MTDIALEDAMKSHAIKSLLRPRSIPKNYRRQKLEVLWNRQFSVKRYPVPSLIYAIPSIKD